MFHAVQALKKTHEDVKEDTELHDPQDILMAKRKFLQKSKKSKSKRRLRIEEKKKEDETHRDVVNVFKLR